MIQNELRFGSFLEATVRYYEPVEQSQKPTDLPDEEADASLEVTSKTSSGTTSPMTWQQRGDYHLNRNEMDLAIQSFTKSLQQSEKRHDREQVGNNIMSLGIVYLKKEQWALATKFFNAAYAILHKTTNEKGLKIALGWMSEVEKQFLNKVCGIKKNPDPQIYLQWREKLEKIRSKFRFSIFASDFGNNKMDSWGIPGGLFRIN